MQITLDVNNHVANNLKCKQPDHMLKRQKQEITHLQWWSNDLNWWLSLSEKGRDGEKAVRGRREGEMGKRSEGFLCYKTTPYFLLLDKIALKLIIKKCHMRDVQSGMPNTWDQIRNFKRWRHRAVWWCTSTRSKNPWKERAWHQR